MSRLVLLSPLTIVWLSAKQKTSVQAKRDPEYIVDSYITYLTYFIKWVIDMLINRKLRSVHCSIGSVNTGRFNIQNNANIAIQM